MSDDFFTSDLFTVVCDETNNKPEDVDAGRLTVDFTVPASMDMLVRMMESGYVLWMDSSGMIRSCLPEELFEVYTESE